MLSIGWLLNIEDLPKIAWQKKRSWHILYIHPHIFLISIGKGSYWKIMRSTTMYHLYITGKDGFKGIAQLWLVRKLQNTLLVMIDKKHWGIKIRISTKTWNKLRDSLKTHGIIKGAWDPASFDTELSISVKKAFVDTLVKIMPDDKCKTRVKDLLYNRTYLFTYDMKTTKPGKFPDPDIFYVDNF